jgi:metal-dependent amidase/aminoacylase/carboxypeptidase family protein
MIRAGVLESPTVSALLALKVQPALRVAEIAVDTSSGGGGVVPFRMEMRSPSVGACDRPGPGCPDLIAAASQLVLNLRNLPHSRMDASSRVLVTVGAISAGQGGNLLPASLSLRGSIRWRRPSERDLAMHLVRQTAAAAATVSGARVGVQFEQGGVLIGNNPSLARWTLGTAVRVLRKEGIRISSVPPVTDPGFDLFRRRVPSVLIQLGVSARGGKVVPLRSGGFVADERALAVGVNLLVNLLVDYLLDASGDLRGVEGAPRSVEPHRAAPTAPPRS